MYLESTNINSSYLFFLFFCLLYWAFLLEFIVNEALCSQYDFNESVSLYLYIKGKVMKPTLKTTALAMCIALSLTACKSTSNSGDARPTPVQPEAATKAEAAAKEAAAKAEAAAKEEAAKAEAAAKEAAAKAEAAKEAAAAAAKEAEAPKPAASSYDDLKKLFYLPVVDGKSSDLVNATYKGKVFAKVKLSNTDEERFARTTIGEDGDVTLNVQKDSSDKFKMSGTIDSTTVGTISFVPKEIIKNKVNGGHVDFGDEASGSYSATISKDGSDIVGRVNYIFDPDSGMYPTVAGKDGEIKYLFDYEAFFDATKQLK